MFESIGFFLSWFLVFVLCGAMVYVFDRTRGVRVYRWLYDMTHEQPLAADVSTGFVFHRSAQTRFTIAVIVSIFQSVAAVLERLSSVTHEILSVFVEVPCIMLGFYLGPTLWRIWSRRDEVFNTVDKIEKGEISIKDEVQEASHKAVSKVKEVLGVEHQGPDETASAAPEKVEAPEPEPDPKELMGKYLNH